MNSNYFKNMIIGNIFHTQNQVPFPSKFYIGLSGQEPTASGICFEPTTNGTGYSRVEITGFSTDEDGSIYNTNNIVFPTSVTNWGTITHYAVFDSANEGNMLFYGKLNGEKEILPYSSFVINKGCLRIILDGHLLDGDYRVVE